MLLYNQPVQALIIKPRRQAVLPLHVNMYNDNILDICFKFKASQGTVLHGL